MDYKEKEMGIPKQRIFTNSLTSENMPTFKENYLYNNNVLPSMNNICEFYKDAKILITGATGFVGKAIVEKLLRTCDGVDSIYILIRPKRGLIIEQRLKELLKNPVFNRVREKQPDDLNKVKAIFGDVSLPNLGVNDADRAFIIDNIDIVFHSAATVKFNEDLKNAVTLNTLGTKRVLEICENMKKLKSFVHVSTAYSNSDKKVVDEIIYKPQYDPNSIINCIDILPEEGINILAESLLGRHPNTYTFTKAMAEALVFEKSSIIPTAIVRPSIITPAWKEPYPGWVDNVSGITGIVMECGRGIIKTIIADESNRMDLIPVDIVVNTVITAAWHTASYRSNTLRIYNCTSGNINPITWKEVRELTLKYSRMYPSKYLAWYPDFTFRKNKLMHYLCAAIFQAIPAAFMDVFLYCTRQRPIMLRLCKKFYNAVNAGVFFATNEWDFKINTMMSLIQAVKAAEDGKYFDINIGKENGFDWDAYGEIFIQGVRKFLLKDDMSSLEQARAKMQRLYWIQKLIKICSILALLKIAGKMLTF